MPLRIGGSFGGRNAAGIDFGRLEAKLSQVGEKVVKHGIDAMRDEAQKIQELAQDYAPVELGDVERSIKVTEDRSGINRRTVVYVYVDLDEPAGYPTKDGPVYNGTTTVGDYVRWLHSDYSYALGPKSREKMLSTGYVGPEFLTKALSERAKPLHERVRAMVARALRTKG